LTLDAWTIVLTVGALAPLALLLGFAIRFAKAKAARAEALQVRIDFVRGELDTLRSRHGSGELAREEFAAEEKRLTRDLLESVAALPAAPARQTSFGGRRGATWIAALVVLTGATLLILARAPATPPRAGEAPTMNREALLPAPAAGADQRPVFPLSDAQLEHMVAEAGAQVRKAPDDAHAWAMLAHSYDMLGRFAESSKAYANLVRLAPHDAQALADYADALAVASGRTLAGEPTVLIERALKSDAKNLKALALAGTAAFERKEYGTAVAFWERARAVSSDATFRNEIEGSIAEAQAAEGGRPIGERISARGPAASAAVAPNGATVSGRVSLADEFAAKLSAEATVFIFARPAKGSRMPVALLRKHVRDLPVDFTLDDSMSMVPGVTLSKAGRVVIGARVSQGGDVTPQPGDVQGWSAPVDVGSRGLKVEMSEVIK
jgi:cytochrome c-type biogenesis protein CcmH